MAFLSNQWQGNPVQVENLTRADLIHRAGLRLVTQSLQAECYKFESCLRSNSLVYRLKTPSKMAFFDLKNPNFNPFPENQTFWARPASPNAMTTLILFIAK